MSISSDHDSPVRAERCRKKFSGLAGEHDRALPLAAHVPEPCSTVDRGCYHSATSWAEFHPCNQAPVPAQSLTFSSAVNAPDPCVIPTRCGHQSSTELERSFELGDRAKIAQLIAVRNVP